jgi:hypothetical protein
MFFKIKGLRRDPLELIRKHHRFGRFGGCSGSNAHRMVADR